MDNAFQVSTTITIIGLVAIFHRHIFLQPYFLNCGRTTIFIIPPPTSGEQFPNTPLYLFNLKLDFFAAQKLPSINRDSCFNTEDDLFFTRLPQQIRYQDPDKPQQQQQHHHQQHMYSHPDWRLLLKINLFIYIYFRSRSDFRAKNVYDGIN